MTFDIIAGMALGAMTTILLLVLFDKPATRTEDDELRDQLADDAVDYCEHKRFNRMESFQRAKWERYVATAQQVEELAKPDAPEPIISQLRRMVAHVRGTK
jgi:hypothetical protein